jgi:hypothetical protein
VSDLTSAEIAEKADAYAANLGSIEGLRAALQIIAGNVRDLTAPRAAPVSEEEGSEGRAIRPEVLAFARVMSAKIDGHNHDRGEHGWRTARTEQLVEWLRRYYNGLLNALAKPAPGDPREVVLSKAANVANLAMMIADVCGGLRAPAPPPSTGDEAREIERLRAQKDGAYRERDQVVALVARMALALGWRAGVRRHEPDPDPTWDEDWKNVVAIDLPTGQVTWHYHDSEVPLFIGLPDYQGSWDGHDTAEKYRRVHAAWPSPRAQTGTDEDAARIEREAYEENVRRVVTALASGNPTCTCRDPQHGDRFLRATCVGAYEDERNIGFGCDTCCGHGNEDGWCVPLRSAALRREERDPRLAALEEAARVVDGLAAHTSREDEEQRAWLYAYAKAAAAIRALSSPATNPEPETKKG